MSGGLENPAGWRLQWVWGNWTIRPNADRTGWRAVNPSYRGPALEAEWAMEARKLAVEQQERWNRDFEGRQRESVRFYEERMKQPIHRRRNAFGGVLCGSQKEEIPRTVTDSDTIKPNCVVCNTRYNQLRVRRIGVRRFVQRLPIWEVING